MPLYICSRCLKKFDRVSNYKRHINRQVPCSMIACDLNEDVNSDVKKKL